MNKQNIFNFDFKKVDNDSNFFVNSTNIDAYNGIINKNYNKLFLIGPNKSGKSTLGEIWCNKYKGIKYDNNFDNLINNKQNILIDNIELEIDEEKLFYLINHSILNNLHILITSSFKLSEINLKLSDLISRLKIFNYLTINQPDDEMLINILTKLFVEKQFIVNSQDIFQFILNNTDRSYFNMLEIVKKLDTLTIEKKRQLTIPLIKEIL